MPRHMIWGERRGGRCSRPAPPLAADLRRSPALGHVALAVFYNGACPVCRGSIERYQAASAGRSRLIAWCDTARRPGRSSAGHAETGRVVLRLHIVDADGRLLVGAAAFARLWRELPGYRWAGRLVGLPGIGLLAEGLYRLNLAVNPAYRDLDGAACGTRHA